MMPQASAPGEAGQPATAAAPSSRGPVSVFSRTVVNVLAAGFYALFLIAAVRFFLRTGSPVGLGLVAFNTLFVACLLTRRAPAQVTACQRNWLIAALVQLLPLLLRPVAGAPISLAVAAFAGQIAALGLMGASLVVLNRSLGIVAANRGVKTAGPYRWMRHPLYAGEIAFFASFLLANCSTSNVLLVLLLVAGQVARLLQEEALLLADDDYRRYQDSVPYRLVPGVF